MALGVGALYAYDQQYVGRVLPGVSVGDVDLSGMTEAEASAVLAEAYASLGEGSVVVTGPDGDVTFTYAALGRQADVAGMTAAAMAAGRSGNPAERAISNARVALRGVEIDPMVVVDQAAIATKLTTLAESLYRDPTEASVTADVKKGFTVIPGDPGRSADATSRSPKSRVPSPSSTPRVSSPSTCRSRRSTPQSRPKRRRRPVPSPPGSRLGSN